jgi:hypothetical protein
MAQRATTGNFPSTSNLSWETSVEPALPHTSSLPPAWQSTTWAARHLGKQRAELLNDGTAPLDELFEEHLIEPR